MYIFMSMIITCYISYIIYYISLQFIVHVLHIITAYVSYNILYHIVLYKSNYKPRCKI